MLDPDVDTEVHMGSHKLSWLGAMFDHVCGQMHMDSHWFYSCSNAHKLWCPPKHESINSVNKVGLSGKIRRDEERGAVNLLDGESKCGFGSEQ